ncbi:putative G-protein coupled receptor AH9.1 [Orchesella cincta]|uniref:Putative G-protein coupled receptor AH9.1 n=1 Tax=Orchesella cincta TaxID=48709 RepID=A0A1D2N6R1_ORCCI|nr:putative G-protein coupled receptor AH9.1 [Orchesella cincta]
MTCSCVHRTKSDCDYFNGLFQEIGDFIFGPTVVAIGLLGNVLNLIVLTRPSMKGVTYSYLTGLAFSDLGVLLFAVGMMIRQINLHSEKSWAMAFFYSHLEIPMANMFMASSIFIVVCLTIDRFISVCLPARFRSAQTSARPGKVIFLCYCVAFIISAPLAFLKHVCAMVDPVTNETIYSSPENTKITLKYAWKMYIITEEIIIRFGPAIILASLNFLIILRFRQITKKRREILNAGGDATGNDQLLLRGERISKRIYKEEKRLVVLLTAIVVLFFITTTPVAFLAILYSDKMHKNFAFQIFRAMANDLELCNFALNFYIYFLCSKEFRKKFLSFFTILIPQKAKTNIQSITLENVAHNKVPSTLKSQGNDV